MFGKLHFGNNPKGFDQFKILPGQGKYYNPVFITKDEGKIEVEGYVTDIITDMTLNWLENERTKEDPFLLFTCTKRLTGSGSLQADMLRSLPRGVSRSLRRYLMIIQVEVVRPMKLK